MSTPEYYLNSIQSAIGTDMLSEVIAKVIHQENIVMFSLIMGGFFFLKKSHHMPKYVGQTQQKVYVFQKDTGPSDPEGFRIKCNYLKYLRI